jgi:transposase
LTSDDVIEALGGWEGYSVEKIEVDQEEGEKAQVWIELTPLLGIARRCSGCGRMVEQVHDVTPRWVRELPILGAETWLWLGRVRVACPD